MKNFFGKSISFSKGTHSDFQTKFSLISFSLQIFLSVLLTVENENKFEISTIFLAETQTPQTCFRETGVWRVYIYTAAI